MAAEHPHSATRADEPDEQTRPYLATAAKGTEGALKDELRELGLPRVRADRGGVWFGGDLGAAMRVCVESRIAQRVLLRLGEQEARDAGALYEAGRTVDWSRFVDPSRTLAVTAHVKGSALSHSGFVAQRTKDAIVDQLRERCGARPSVARKDPDLHVVVHIAKDRARFFADLAGEPLHRRGYRSEALEAPIKETLAAAMLRIAGWDRARPLVDPMCGSGTIAIEAYLWAYDVAPGLLRERYGFERWSSHDAAARRALGDLRSAARERVKRQGPSVIALDVDGAAASLTRKLAKQAGAKLHVERADVGDFMGTHPAGHVVTNPPYGQRIARSDDFERRLAQSFRELHGHRVSVICHDPRLRDAMRARPAHEHALWNGDLECRLFSWDIR